MLDSGLPGDHPAMRDAAKWLIDHQIFKKGDWSVKRPDLEPGGWAFEFYNDWYPDVDDSAVILMVLADPPATMRPQASARFSLGANWVMGMQSKDGGFAAFDVDNKSTWLNHATVPADTEAATDPTCPDLTGRVLEMMAAVGYRADHPVARRAIEWLKRDQEDRRFVVGALGGQLYLRHLLRACRACARSASISSEPWIQALGRMDQVEAESGRRMGREPVFSDKDPALARARHQHAFANRMGDDRR